MKSFQKRKILIVEDDVPLAYVLSRKIEQIGYLPVTTSDGKKALSELMESDFAVALIDIGLPNMDGLTIVQTIRNENYDTPCIIITSKSSTAKAIESFQNGANLFHAKPINFELLISQIKMLAKQHLGDRTITTDGILIDPLSRKFEIGGKFIPTTYKEFELLKLLINNPNKTFGREEILRRTAKGRRDIEIGSIDTLVSRLRRKLGKNQEIIETVHGIGFRYNQEAIS